MMVVQDLAKRAMIRKSSLPSCPYMVKSIQTTSSPEPLGQFVDILHETYGGTSLYKIADVS